MKITEDYVSFDIAVLLKEARFNESVNHVYSDKKELLQLKDYGIRDLTNSECDNYKNWQFPIEKVNSIISAPTLQMTMKWLRIIHKIHIELAFDGKGYFPVCISTKTNKPLPYKAMQGKPFKYEEACEVAIKFCLEHFI